MLVDDVQASIHFYHTLGFHVSATEMNADGQPLWALLRRDDADLFIERRDQWPAHVVPLAPQRGALSLVLEGRDVGEQTDPDGTTVCVEPAQRRAA